MEDLSSLSEKDLLFMERAFDLAQEALDGDEVPVGCVFVCDGVEIGSGRNEVNKTRDPTAHAEMVAIRRMQVNRENFKELLPNMVLYVTLEPCIMCASALYQLGIKKIYYGAANDRFGGIHSVGSREKYKETHDIEVVPLIMAGRAVDMLKKFYDKQNPFAPDDKRKVKKKNDSEHKLNESSSLSS